MKIKDMYYSFIAVAVRYCAFGLLIINLGMCLTVTLGLGLMDFIGFNRSVISNVSYPLIFSFCLNHKKNYKYINIEYSFPFTIQYLHFVLKGFIFCVL